MKSLAFLLVVAAPWVAPRAQPLATEIAFPTLTFVSPVDLQHAGDGTDRLFVVEQAGRIRVFPNDRGAPQATTFLDIRSRVLSDSRFGMLGLAFHPDYAANGQFFVHYTAASPQRSVISRFRVSAGDPNVADPASEEVLLEVGQPHNFHNGGALAFGPDGFLYIPLGDGGPGRDPRGEGQNRQTLLGSVLRIDVDAADPGLAYRIPPDNPFVGNGQGWREEIWAWGLRNPWRIHFDEETGVLWAGENGEDRRDEIDHIEAGANYGWSTMEGSLCFSPMTGCSTSGLALPFYEYADPPRRSVIGGVVYRGERTPEIAGRYVFGDFVLGRIWSLSLTAPPTRTLLASSGLVALSSFGVDEAGELYFADAGNGRILRFVPTAVSTEEAPEGARPALLPPAPNPASGEASLTYQLPEAASVRLLVTDALGREVARLVDGSRPAGTHRAEWRHEGAAAGVYRVLLLVDGVAASRSVTVAR